MQGEGKKSLVPLMLAATAYMVAGTLFQPVFPLYVRAVGATTLQVGLLVSLKQFLPLILRVPLSIAGERFGRRKILIGSLLVLSTAAVLYSRATSFLQLVAIVLFESFSSAINPFIMSTVSDMSPSDRQGDAMGRYLTFLGLGMLLGPALCSLLVESLGYSQLFMFASAFPIIGVALIVYGAPKFTGASSEVVATQNPGARESLRMILTNRNVLLLSYCRASFATSQNIILTLFPLYAADVLGFSDSTVAFLFTIRGLSNTMVRLPAGLLSDRIGRRKPMIAAYAMLVVAFALTATVQDYTLLVAAFAVYGFSWGIRAVSEWAFLTDLVEPEVKTLSISYLSSVFSLGSTLGSIIAGVLTTFIPYTCIFLLATALMVPPIPVITVMKKSEEKPG